MAGTGRDDAGGPAAADAATDADPASVRGRSGGLFPGAEEMAGVVPGDETVESVPLELDGPAAAAGGGGPGVEVEVEDVAGDVDEAAERDDGADAAAGEVIRQQNVGPGRELGSGEHPDPSTPPQAPAPGA